MRIWIDCEFNSYLGELISLALVTEAGDEFYRVVEINGPVDPWVADNVMTVLHMPSIPLAQFHAELENFLRHFDAIHVIADWPDDIAYFMRALITGPGTRLDTPPMTMEVVRYDAPSDIPHNALADARGIRDYMLGEIGLNDYEPPSVAQEITAVDAVVDAYNTWPIDIRKKLSLHDLRRMTGWDPIREAGREWWALRCPPWPGGINFRTMGEALDCIDKNGDERTFLATWIHQASRIDYNPAETKALIAGRKAVKK